MDDKNQLDTGKQTPKRVEGAPELPSDNMEDARQEGLVAMTPEAEIENKQAEETGKDQPLPEDIAEVNAMPDSEVEKVANEAAAAVGDEPAPLEGQTAVVSGKPGKFTRFKQWCGRHKFWTVILILAVVIGILAAVPWTRYTLAGLVYKQQFNVVVIDSQTNKPVSAAKVELGGETAETDNKGKATIKHKVGKATLKISKAYYANQTKDVLVPILKQKQPVDVQLKATGRQISVTVINKVSGKPVENAHIKAAGGIHAKTDNKGKTELVVPADKKTIQAALSADGYNAQDVTIAVDEGLKPNEFSLVPSGRVYFLSNQSGTIDVVKTNLDGSDRKVVVQGTGKEDPRETTLLASHDWKYAVLQSKRDDGKTNKLYLIETATDRATIFDEGNVQFSITGWVDNDTFAYTMQRANINAWESGRTALKTYNAATRKLTTIDQTVAQGDQSAYIYQNMSPAVIISNKLVYAFKWQRFGTSSAFSGQTDAIRAVQPNGQGKKDIKTFDPNTVSSIVLAQHAPNTVDIKVDMATSGNSAFYTYDGTALKDASLDDDVFYGNPNVSYIDAPTGSKVLWSSIRDGKSVLLVGDQSGKGEQVPGIVNYRAYGWYTDQYILASQNNNELFILSVDGGTPLKIANYFNPGPIYGGNGNGGI